MMLCIYWINKTTFNSKLREVDTVQECQSYAGATTSYIAQSSNDYVSRAGLSSTDISDLQQYAVEMFAAAFAISLLKRLFR